MIGSSFCIALITEKDSRTEVSKIKHRQEFTPFKNSLKLQSNEICKVNWTFTCNILNYTKTLIMNGQL